MALQRKSRGTVGDVVQGEVIPRPKGGKGAKGNVITAAAFQDVCSYVVASGKRYQMASMLVSCDHDIVWCMQWDGTPITGEHYLSAKIPFPLIFVWDQFNIVGDGVKKVVLQAKFPAGGAAGDCQGEFTGEEV